MTLVLTAALRMEAAQAKAELAATQRSVDGLKTATEAQTRAARTSTGATDANTAAKRRNAQASHEVANANTVAAGATGNLVAQFNDISMMIAAGQSPLQLAIQQGTQVAQVIGPMGAAGAVGLLKDAFISLLNPINLVTLGVVYFGAQAVQSLMATGQEAAAVVEHLDAIRQASAETQTQIDKLRFGVDEEYQVELLREQLRLRSEYNTKVAELQGYLSTTTDSIDRQRMSTADLRGEIEAIVTRYAEINAALADQQNRSTQLAVLEGVKAQRAGEMAAKQQEAARAAENLQAKIAAIVGSLNAADGSRLVAAFQAAFPVASQLLGMAQGIIATINQAGAFQSAETAGLAAQYAQYGAGRVAGERLAKESGPLFGNRRVIPLPTGAAGSGGGAAAARDEASALQELIASLEAEIEALRVQDPLQQEMLKHREALAGATEAERQKVEELIATREREALLMEGAKARAAFFEDIGTQALDALIMKGESFNDVLQNIIRSLIQAVAQAAIFGSGPFGSLFGGKSILSGLFGGGGGGGLAGLFGSGKAEGGMIYGPGTGTSDSILTPTSNGEFVVNAQATARNRQLLEVINAGGQVRGFATGGYVGSDTRRLAARGDSNLPASIYIDLRGSNGDQAIEERVRKGAAEVVQLYDREGLAVSMQRVSSDPKRRG